MDFLRQALVITLVLVGSVGMAAAQPLAGKLAIIPQVGLNIPTGDFGSTSETDEDAAFAKIGYCEPSCTLCGQVCPTGAINELTLTQKVGDEGTPPNRIGTAFFDRGRCLPWAMATPCIVCEEWCPTSPKAIYLREEIAIDRLGNEVRVQRPYVDPALCTGCGACEYACPVFDRKAVYVTSVGESRSEANQILLERGAP